MSNNKKLLSFSSSKKNHNLTGLGNKENEESNVSENISLISSQLSGVVEIESSTQLFSDTSNNSCNNSKAISNKKVPISKKAGQILHSVKKSSKASNSPKPLFKKKTKNKKSSSCSSNEIILTSSTSSVESSLQSCSNTNLISGILSKSKSKHISLNVTDSRLKRNTLQSSEKSAKSSNKNKTKSNRTQKNVTAITDELQSISKENLISNSDQSTEEIDLIKKKRKKINLSDVKPYISDSSEKDDLFDSGLSSSTRKAKNREYALNSSNQNKSIKSKSKKNQPTSISSICKILQNDMHLHHKTFKDQLVHKNKQLDMQTSDFDVVMRGTAHAENESLYFSDTGKNKLLSSSSSSLPELEIELKTPPRVEERETLTSDSKSTSVNEQLSDLHIEYHSPPSIPKEISGIQKNSDNEGSIYGIHNEEYRADSDDAYNTSPINPVASSNSSNSRLIHSWLMKDVSCDNNEIIKKIGEEMLLSDARMIRVLLQQITKQPINTSLTNFCDILTEINYILGNYFKERL